MPPDPILDSALAAAKQATPGQWTIERYGDGDTLVIHSDHVSRVCFMATPGSYGDPAKIEADATLIAAAPTMAAEIERLRAVNDELVKALTWAESALAPFSKEPAEKSGINMVRSALAKAKVG